MHTNLAIQALIGNALAEDQAWNDATTTALISPNIVGNAKFVAKETGTLAGIDIALQVFQKLDESLACTRLLKDGSTVQAGDILGEINGCAGNILRGERTALNFLQRLSGIATQTAGYVKALEGSSTILIDTRKTAPGLRELDKYAVRMGGGKNHRMNLNDGILIKDNHLATLKTCGMSLQEVVKMAMHSSPHTLKIEVEVETLEQAREALKSGAHILLLDNMSLEEMREVTAMAQGKALTEASGGINLTTVKAVAATGVDLVSVGALTHSVQALDISLELE